MAISLPLPPPDALTIVREKVPLLLGEGAFPPTAPDPEIGQPWPVHINTTERLTNGQVLVATLRVAWQYPIFAGDEILGLAEVSIEPLQWTALHPPEAARRILNRISLIEALKDGDAGDFELRLIQVASASLLAVWLHGDEDVIAPIEQRLDVGDEVLADVLPLSQLTATFAPLVLLRATAIGRLGG